jgi:hypothetical protein
VRIFAIAIGSVQRRAFRHECSPTRFRVLHQNHATQTRTKNSERIMLLKSSLSIAPSSGFVAFDGGGTVEADAHRFTAKAPVLVPQPCEQEPLLSDAGEASELRQSAVWQPSVGLRARRVEGTVIVAICAYFLFGCASLLGWI